MSKLHRPPAATMPQTATQDIDAVVLQSHAQPLSSNPPSPADPPVRQNGLLNPWNNTGSGRKRSYSDLNEFKHAPSDPSAQLQAEFDGAAEDGHADKRSRRSHWPLSPNGGQNESKSSRSSRTPKHGSSRNRRKIGKPSKFIEGSMRDRDSDMPPDQFLHDDMALEDYENGTSGNYDNGVGTRVRDSEDTNTSFDAGIERNRPSSMYRFGKAIANAFNPASMWNGIFGKEKTEESPSDDTMQDRKTQAENAYAELKRSGFKGTNKHTSARSSTDLSVNRDSGVDVSSYRSSGDHKRDGLVFDESGMPLLPPPPIPDDDTQPSPGTEYSSGPGSGRRIHKRRPSMPSLQKMKSHFSLSAAKRDPASPLPSIETDGQQQRINKKQSKKDLQKQQKLSKKISNLETQLDKAKKELNKTIGIGEEVEIKEENEDYEDIKEEETDEELGEETEIEEAMDTEPQGIPQTRYTPSGRRFVPNLPTLPSERVLFAQAKKSQTPAGRYPNRDLPPKSVDPDPLTLSLENALGMHDDEQVIAPKKSRASLKKRDEKKVSEKKATTATPKKVAKVSPKGAAGRKDGTKGAKANATRKVSDSAIVSDEEPESAGKAKATKKTGRKRRKSSGAKDTTFKPTANDSENEDGLAPSESAPKKRATRQSTARRTSAQNMKENAKPSASTSVPVNTVAAAPFKTAIHQSGLSVGQPSNQVPVKDAALSPLSTASTIDDPALFANATAYAPEMKSLNALAAMPPTRAAPAPPATAGATTGGSFAQRAESLAGPTKTRMLSPPPRETSPTAVPLPAGSPIRGGASIKSTAPTKSLKTMPSTRTLKHSNSIRDIETAKEIGSLRAKSGSPKPALKRAGRSGPIREPPVSITPGKDVGRGVPPVPKIPEGVEGRRTVVRKSPGEGGDGWKGWDDDVF